jgi:YegS/Rv2252/BmrU family lipid kinase
MLRALAIINPRSGAQRAADVAQMLHARAAERGVALDVRETRADQPAAALLEDARAFDRVIAAGGDGTLMDVFTGLMRFGSRGPLAIVPAGTGNVLARGLGVATDLARACDLALDPDACLLALDLGRAQFQDGHEAWFALRLSAGYEAHVLETTTPELKSNIGVLAYFLQGVAHAVTSTPAEYRCDVDGEPHVQRALAALVVNHATLGVLGMAIAPDINPDDGQLDLCLVSLEPGVELVGRIVAARTVADAIIAARLPVRREVVIVADPPQPVQADGDVIGITPVRVTPIASAIDICVSNLQAVTKL